MASVVERAQPCILIPEADVGRFDELGPNGSAHDPDM